MLAHTSMAAFLQCSSGKQGLWAACDSSVCHTLIIRFFSLILIHASVLWFCFWTFAADCHGADFYFAICYCIIFMELVDSPACVHRECYRLVNLDK